jgi:large repetitive protein
VTTTYAIGSGPIPFYDSTTGQQIVVPLSAITFSGSAAKLAPSFSPQPQALTDWIAYLASVGAISPGPQNPNVTGITPSAGPVLGGTPLTLTGSGLTGATVSFGGAAGTNVQIASDAQLSVTTPKGTQGSVAVVVTTPAGNWTSTGAMFTYVPVPTVSDVSPDSGSVGGWTQVTLTGSGLTGASAVTFGSVPAVMQPGGSDTSLVVLSPPGEALGGVSVAVTAPGGIGTSTGVFTYVPVVTGVSPSSGSLAGNTPVTISGAGFTYATAVNFGNLGTVTVAHLLNATPTEIVLNSPKAPGGTAATTTVDVTVVVTPPGTGTTPATPVTTATSSVDQFTYTT